jgi:hypothetical protein
MSKCSDITLRIHEVHTHKLVKKKKIFKSGFIETFKSLF